MDTQQRVYLTPLFPIYAFLRCPIIRRLLCANKLQLLCDVDPFVANTFGAALIPFRLLIAIAYSISPCVASTYFSKQQTIGPSYSRR